MNTELMFSSDTDLWATPQDTFDKLNEEFSFTLDVCASLEIIKWMEKAYKASLSGTTVVCLVPARTDTKWWHDYAMKGEYRLLRGRLKFGGHKAPAPFPSAIVVFKGKK